MAGKAALNINVSADTSSAQKALKKLDEQVDNMQKRSNRRSKTSGGGDGGSGVPGLPDIDLSKLKLPDLSSFGKLGESLSKVSSVSKLAGGNLAGLTNVLKGATSIYGSAFAAMGFVTDGLIAMTKAGAGAQASFEKINVSLSTLSKNLGGSGDVSHLTTQIQLLAAEGVGNLEQLTTAAQTLMVAFNGNTGAVEKWLPMMDDVAAGSSLTADQFAAMTARVQASGKIETEVLNMLRDRGIPVYKMLGEQAGVTAEAALEMARSGQFGMTEWMSLVEKLHEKYKGLSAELSSNTLQGAIDTYSAMREMAFKGAAEARNMQEIADKNTRAADYKLQAFDQVLQTNLKAAGDLVGRVEAFFSRVGDAVQPENIVAGLMGVMSDITGETENIAQSLVTAALQFRQIPNFAGQSSREIGEYIAAASELYKQLDATLQRNSGLSEETSDEMRVAMEKIKDRLRLAEEAAADVTLKETQAAEELAEQERAAAEAAEAQAKAARDEAAEREKNIKKLEEERLANIKDSEQYRQELKEAAARREMSDAAEKGVGLDFDVAVEKFAMAVSGMNLAEAAEKLDDLTGKIANGNIEEISAEDKETHKRLEKMISEIERLREAAERSTERQNEAEERKRQEEERDRRRAQEATETDAERAKRQTTEDLQEFAEHLKKAGYSAAEQAARMADRITELMLDARRDLLEQLQVDMSPSARGVKDYSTGLLNDLIDDNEKIASMERTMTEKQIKEAVKNNEIAKATLEAIQKFNHNSIAN